MLLAINPHNPQQRLIQQVVDGLKRGDIICYPTDTGYGIGCDFSCQKAVKRIEQIKRRPKGKPFSFMCSDLTNISNYAHVSNIAYRLLKRNLPGPYTFVLPGTKLVPKAMSTKQKTVGIRVPENPICQMLLETLGNPIINTSLPADEDDTVASDPYDIECLYGKLLDLVIDGGEVFSDPSSLIDLTGDDPVVLREGKGDVTPFL
ncbi:translation factor SUA5 [Desulfocapsa sulfexigens DSM 10523]|uniref:Translation factor SUA5 n=1 Tax=Desulfocapsa sulfexigens (strain DSM 10523 / SB164P1) TaxID=1167006 RepID=M1PKT6_DESSD|nr:L-threonylcarbamoyladenylate synthase [Desulfocapsa sulfexigens]AGF77091.1 translation factor SUA5 [Desulfocapsa sulfexigens DSM 10523]